MAQTRLDKFYKVTKKSVSAKSNVEKASGFRDLISSKKEGQKKKSVAKQVFRHGRISKAFIRKLAETILLGIDEESNSSKMDTSKSPIKVVATATSSSPSAKYASPVKSQQHTPTTHSGSKFSPKTASPIKEAFDKSQKKGKLAQRRLFKDAPEELISQAIDNLNLAREGAIANNNINLEKVYASKKFDYEYKSINTTASTRYEIDDVIVPTDTYSLHFFLAVATVFSRSVNCGYFDEDELDYIFSLLTLPRDAQALFVRMLKRKYTWHRISNIKYDEVSSNLRPTFDELVSRFIFRSSMEEEDLSLLLNLLQVDEIRKLCQELKMCGCGKKKKEDCVQMILKLARMKPLFPGMESPGAKVRALVNMRLGGCVLLNGRVKETVDKIITLLIPNRDPTESLSDVFHTILRVETSEIKFPQVKISDFPIFAGKQHLLDYVEARSALSDVLSAIEKKQWEIVRDRGSLAAERLPLILEMETQSLQDSTLPHHIRHFLPGYTWLKVLHKSIDAFKKDIMLTAIKHLQILICQDCHMKHRKGQWYAELIKIEMHHMKNLNASVELLAEALAYKNLTEVDKLDLLERAEMLAKRKTGIDESAKKAATGIADALSKTPLVSPINSVTIKGTLCENTSWRKSNWHISNGIDGSTYGSVEELALYHYRNEGYIKGAHCEGALPVTLFGTLFWDEIYNMDVPGACVSLYQDAPLDLFSSEFYANRKDRIDIKLEIIRNFDVETLSGHLKHKFDTYSEYNRSISASQGTPFDSCALQEIVLCLGVEGIIRICERLIHNYALWKAGFPDLIVWNVHTKQYKIVEVKGPGDSLSTKQKLWLTYLNQLGFNTEVCYCESNHSNGRKRKHEEAA